MIFSESNNKNGQIKDTKESTKREKTRTKKTRTRTVLNIKKEKTRTRTVLNPTFNLLIKTALFGGFVFSALG